MPYTPPLLIKPPLSPLRPPVSPPYRPPGINRLPPTQTAPGYQPPDLLPPTDRDLKGDVCIYSNPPIWEPKYIRYRYPGESWQNVAGESYTNQISNIAGGDYPARWQVRRFDCRVNAEIIFYRRGDCSGLATTSTGIYQNSLNSNIFSGTVTSINWGSTPFCGSGIPSIGAQASLIVNYKDLNNTNRSFSITSFGTIQAIVLPPIQDRNSSKVGNRNYTIAFTNVDDPRPPVYKCTFKVFDRFNQEVISITRDDCPEVFVVPEICYFKPEKEKLVKKVALSANMSLRTEYAGNCSIVWLDLIPLNYFPVQIYKECSSSPTCPPPRIRFDQKCEEKCEQCPSGTALKVLLGNRIACVDAFGCIKKMIKYKPGCNRYDCICL